MWAWFDLIQSKSKQMMVLRKEVNSVDQKCFDIWRLVPKSDRSRIRILWLDMWLKKEKFCLGVLLVLIFFLFLWIELIQWTLWIVWFISSIPIFCFFHSKYSILFFVFGLNQFLICVTFFSYGHSRKNPDFDLSFPIFSNRQWSNSGFFGCFR